MNAWCLVCLSKAGKKKDQEGFAPLLLFPPREKKGAFCGQVFVKTKSTRDVCMIVDSGLLGTRELRAERERWRERERERERFWR